MYVIFFYFACTFVLWFDSETDTPYESLYSTIVFIRAGHLCLGRLDREGGSMPDPREGDRD